MDYMTDMDHMDHPDHMDNMDSMDSMDSGIDTPIIDTTVDPMVYA